MHEYCDAAATGDTSGDYECDDELQGAFGMEATYLKFLLHGSATCSTPGCTPALPSFNVMRAGWDMCEVTRHQLNDRWPGLDAVVGNAAAPEPGDYCSGVVTSAWTLSHENIPPPPAFVSADTTTISQLNLKYPGLRTHYPVCNYH